AYPYVRLNHDLSTDAGSRIDLCTRVDDSARMSTTGRLGARLEQMRDARVGKIGIVHEQRGAGVVFGILRLEQHSASTGIGEILAILGVGQKAELMRASVLQRGQTGYRLSRIATQCGAQLPG